MTAENIITRTDDLKPNLYSTEQKLEWLSILDRQLWEEVVFTHEGYEESPVPAEEYTIGTELLIPHPYAADVYIPYLQARIDQENMEIGKFNQSASLYNAGVTAFRNWWNRNHRARPRMPDKGGVFRAVSPLD